MTRDEFIAEINAMTDAQREAVEMAMRSVGPDGCAEIENVHPLNPNEGLRWNNLHRLGFRFPKED